MTAWIQIAKAIGSTIRHVNAGNDVGRIALRSTTRDKDSRKGRERLDAKQSALDSNCLRLQRSKLKTLRCKLELDT